MSRTDSLWPEIGVAASMPVSILREQAAYLREQTSGRLQGEVDVLPLGRSMRLVFSIVAPALHDYRYKLFEVVHGVDGYPAEVDAYGTVSTATNESIFTSILQQVLTDERTVRVVEQLLALVA